jgi:hypothetical protein
MARDPRLLGGLAAAFAVCLVVAGSSSAASQGAYGPLIEHWDGTAWTRVPAAGAADDLSAVAAVSATDVWAFGTYNINSAVAEHWDGSSWQQVPMPVPQGTEEVELEGAAARSSTDVWAVGTQAGSGTKHGYRTLIEHWDGTVWKVVASPNPTPGPAQLGGVAVLSPKNAWAVGWYKGPHALQTLVLHWNGTKWMRVRSPNPSDPGIRPEDPLAAVAALSARNVWAVGSYLHRKNRRRSYVTLALHWNGKHWKRSPSANPGGVGHANGLDAVAADPAGHLWAAGGYRNGSGSEQPLVERRRTRGWQGVPAQAAPVAAYEAALESLAPLTANDVWAAGTYLDNGRDFAPVALVEHWDGHSWSIVPTLTPVDPQAWAALHGIAAVSATDIWAVGAAGTIG